MTEGGPGSSSYRLSRAEYDRAVEAGVFEPDARLELIDGALLAMTPQGSRHAAAVSLTARELRKAFGERVEIRIQSPLALGDDSEPEPDVAVVPGSARDYRDRHPAEALLVVEVADTSLDRDRTVKQRLYAGAGIPEYWLISLPDARVEVHREAGADGYRRRSTHRAGETIAPAARPGTAIDVGDLLP